jgi:hypothetical protein
MKSNLTIAATICALVLCLPAAAAPKDPQNKGGGKPGTGGKAMDWFLQTRVLVEVDGEMKALDDRSGVIGRLEGALDGKDDHDIKAFANVNGSPGAVVLTQGDEWGGDAGQYLSDYRASGADRQVWTLAVTSNLPNATVTLYWEGLSEITPKSDGGFDWVLNNGNSALKTLRLVDLETGVVTEAVGKRNAINSYTFDMSGAGERLFRWVQGDVLPEDLALSSATSLRAFGPMESQTRAEAFSAPKVDGFGAPPSLDAPAQAERPIPTPSTREP